MRNMVHAAERICHRVNSRAACMAERDTCVVGGAQKLKCMLLPRILAARCNSVLPAGQDEVQRLGGEQLAQCTRIRREIALHRVDHRIDGRSREHRIRQAEQHTGHERRLIREHRGRYQTDLDTLSGAVDDGNVGNLRAGAAGSRHDDQLMLLLEVCHAVVQIVHTVGGLGNGQHLGNVDNGAAADCDNAVKLLAAQVIEDSVNHNVGRLTAAKLFLKTGMAAKIQRRNRRIVNIFIRQNQVTFAEA